jgi:hypothetical protein
MGGVELLLFVLPVLAGALLRLRGALLAGIGLAIAAAALVERQALGAAVIGFGAGVLLGCGGWALRTLLRRRRPTRRDLRRAARAPGGLRR